MSASLLARHQRIKPAAVALEEALVGEFLPDLAAEAGRRLDRDDRLAFAGQRAVAEARVVVKLREFDALLERLESLLQFFVGGRHGAPQLGFVGAGYSEQVRLAAQP